MVLRRVFSERFMGFRDLFLFGGGGCDPQWPSGTLVLPFAFTSLGLRGEAACQIHLNTFYS